MAFEAICPDRIDLIHKNYRKLVNLLADVDEWGQVCVINMLTRYARTQFVDPNLTETVRVCVCVCVRVNVWGVAGVNTVNPKCV